MSYYLTYGEFQEHLYQYYKRTGSKLQFTEMIDYLYKKNILSTTPITFNSDSFFGDMSDEDFNKTINSMPLCVTPTSSIENSRNVQEKDIIPNTRDVFIIRHPRYTRPYSHSHNYFEINFVASGQCSFIFEDNVIALHEGEVCIIAPSSSHDIIINDDSTVFSIMLRKSTFDTTFFSLLSRKDLLSCFFRTILQDDMHSNYLLFFASESKGIKKIIRNLMGECHGITDAYSNSCCINWINLMFSELLRYNRPTFQFYNYQIDSDFSLILQYIQHNYQTLTLSTLAEYFHYSEPHLSTLIKQNLGYTFTELIKRLRMSDAVDLLINTNMKISEIAEKIGYNSADHFTRVFRKSYLISPQEYRKNSRSKPDFIPFKME